MGTYCSMSRSMLKDGYPYESEEGKNPGAKGVVRSSSERPGSKEVAKTDFVRAKTDGVSRESTPDQEKAKKIMLTLASERKQCDDCSCQNAAWAIKPHGTVVCIYCSGLHRGLGVDVSFVQSLTLDIWPLAEAESFAKLVRGGANEALEWHVPAQYKKPREKSSMDVRRQYITAKYKDQLFKKGPKTNNRGKLAAQYMAEGEGEAGATDEAQEGLVETVGILFITLKRGKDLINADLVTVSDPQCVISTSDDRQCWTSKTINNSLNPVWNQSFSLTVAKLDHLKVQVWDIDVGGRDDLGHAVVDVADCTDGKIHAKVAHLTAVKENRSIIKGTIELDVRFQDLSK